MHGKSHTNGKLVLKFVKMDLNVRILSDVLMIQQYASKIRIIINILLQKHCSWY